MNAIVQESADAHAAGRLDVLLVEDDPEDVRLILDLVQHRAYGDVEVRFVVAQSLAAATVQLEGRGFDAVALDLNLADARGVTGVQALHAQAPQTPIVVVTGARDSELARHALAAGAQDYLIKGTDDGELLVRSLRFAVERQRLQAHRERTGALLRQRAEQLLAANAKLTAAADARDELLAVVSHELRTPLTPILGFAQLLAARYADQLDPDAVSMLDAIERNAARMQSHVETLLGASWITSDGETHDHDREVVALAPLVHRLIAEQLPGGMDAQLEIDDSAEVHASPAHLEQILTNLLTNAVKYGRPPVTVTATETEAQTAIAVADSGDGVPAAFEPQLFDRFRQASTGTRRTASGVGLGLYLARQLAVLHDGELAYEPAPDAPGARFVLRLPKRSAAVHGSTERSPTGNGAGHGARELPEPSAVIVAAVRQLLHAVHVDEIGRIVDGAIHALGGVVVPLADAGEEAVDLDVSLGLTEPMLPIPSDDVARRRLERLLPQLLEDARQALASLRARADDPAFAVSPVSDAPRSLAAARSRPRA